MSQACAFHTPFFGDFERYGGFFVNHRGEAKDCPPYVTAVYDRFPRSQTTPWR
jgi:hypothetical protein